MTPQQHWKAMEGLRDALKAADDLLSAERALVDTFARGRNYRDLAKVAGEMQRVATQAEETRRQLDQLMTDSAIANKP
jgi:hypothetical protein